MQLDEKEIRCVLFTGGGGAGSEALSRLLSKKYEVHFADADINAKPYLIADECWHQIPLATSPDFIEKVGKLCDKLEIDVFVPTVDEELIQIANIKNEFGCDVLLPPPDFVETHLDKYQSMSSLKEFELSIPMTELMSNQEHIKLPCIMKPRKGRGSRDVSVVNSIEEINAHLLLSKKLADDFILQELLAGQEYTVMVLADKDANLRAVLPVKIDVKRGITVRAETEDCQSVIDYCTQFHNCYRVPGYYNIQLIKTDSGEIKPFEVNPRASTTACLCLAAGIDFVYESMKPSKSDAGKLLPFTSGLKLRRSWINEFVTPKSTTTG